MGVQTSRVQNKTEPEARLMRFGAWSLPAAGLLLGEPWIRPWFGESADLRGDGMSIWLGPIDLGTFGSHTPTDTAAWARIATSSGYALFTGTQALGLLSLVFGLFVLYGYLAGGRSPRWATPALILSVASIAPAMMMLGVLAFAEPVVAGLYQNGVDACPGPRAGGMGSALCTWLWGSLPSTGVALALLALELASVITLCVAIWRSGLLPRWVALAFGAAYVGSIAISPVVTLVGGLLMMVAGGWITLQLNRKTAGRSSSRNALPAALRT
jgi:hypothetical protein